MSKEAEIAAKFWKALRSDRTVMLGLSGVDEGHSQPMTAYLEGDEDTGPIWFFSAKRVDLVKVLGIGKLAVMHFAAMRHEVFATVHGYLVPDNDAAMIDRLWDPVVAAWFGGGRGDPQLQLLRFDPDHGQIWLNENSLFSEIKILLGKDPKIEYRDKVAEVDLTH